MTLLNGEWRCDDCGTDLNTDGGHAAFHSQCWRCYDAKQNAPLDKAAIHYEAADLWCMGHVNEDSAEVAIVNALLAIERRLRQITDELQCLR